jgi:hypothetical protein
MTVECGKPDNLDRFIRERANVGPWEPTLTHLSTEARNEEADCTEDL